MELSIYDVIKKIIISPKSVELRRKFGKITFEVNKGANKIVVRDAVEKIWNVKVRDVRIINTASKTKMVGKKMFEMANSKKAIITLKDGYVIDLPDHLETMGLSQSSQAELKEGAK